MPPEFRSMTSHTLITQAHAAHTNTYGRANRPSYTTHSSHKSGLCLFQCSCLLATVTRWLDVRSIAQPTVSWRPKNKEKKTWTLDPGVPAADVEHQSSTAFSCEGRTRG
jgi:hypothetical protein